MLLAAVATFAAVAFAQPSDTRQKARYYYLEGARMQAEGHMPEAYEYYKKAYLIDPTYVEAAAAYGLNRLMVQTDTLQTPAELRRSLGMLREYVDTYPGDNYENTSYAFVATRLDTLPEAIRIYERLDSLKPGNGVNLLQLSDVYMASHNPAKALETLDRFERLEGKSPQLSLKKMSFMLASHDTVAAEREANALIESNPREPAFHILKGNLYEVIGNNDSTLAAYLEAERLAPDNGAAKLALANYYKMQGDSVKYDSKVYDALLSEDFRLEEKLSLLSEYLQTLLDGSSDTARGDHLFSVLMEQYPHEPQVLDLAARYSGAKGNFKEAEEQMQYALDQDPTNASYWTQLMRFQLADDRGTDAMATYRLAEDHVKPTEDMMLFYASGASLAKKYADAEKMYGELIHSIIPGLPLTDSINDPKARNQLSYEGLSRMNSLYTMLGDMYYTSGDLDKTFRAYDNALYFLPNSPMTLNNYAYFLVENGGDVDRAETMSKQAIEQEPENDTYLDTYAWVLFKKKDYPAALEYQQKAIEAAKANGSEENAEFYSHLGDILFWNEQPKEAVENWKKALELEPDNELLKKKIKAKNYFVD